MPSLCRTRRFLRSPASLRSPSLIMSSTPFTEVGCMGLMVPSVFFLILCSCMYSIDILEKAYTRFPGPVKKANSCGVLYLSFIIDQLKLSGVCHRDLRPDCHPDARVHPYKIPLVGETRSCNKMCLTKKALTVLKLTIWASWILELCVYITETLFLTLLKCSIS